VARLMEDFAVRGLRALDAPSMPCSVSCWLMDRWDEVALRVMVHGPRGSAPASDTRHPGSFLQVPEYPRSLFPAP
jgi:hypothetical protein